MFKINLYLLNIKNVIVLPRYMFKEAIQNSFKPSFRPKSQLSEEKYENHQHICYSSYLELQGENVICGIKKRFQNKPKNFHVFQRDSNALNHILHPPKNWMEDYEYYNAANDEGRQSSLEHNDGTADPAVLPSSVPCSGCGANLQCNYAKSPGYLPSEIFKGRSENELKTIICQRCHFLKYYNQAIDLEVTPNFYIKTISSIQDKFALAVVVVDLLDFPCSIWPEMTELLGSKRPVFIVGNKVDLLPRDSNSYLNHIKECLKKEVLKVGFNALNVKNICLISAKTGYGIEEFITQLQKVWAYKGDVYLLGCTNVGKSSLFNILLNSDYSRPESMDLICKATTSPWPGTTLHMLKFPIHRPSDIRVYERFKRISSERFLKAEQEKLREEYAHKLGSIADAVPVGLVGRTFVKNVNDDDDMFAMPKGVQPIITLNERSKEYKMAKWVYDTPGVLHPDQITDLLTPQELHALQPKQMISPRAYRLKTGMSLYVAGLSRLDFITSDSNDLSWIKIFLFASFDLPTMIVETDYAADIYGKYINTPLMKVPMENREQLRKWPGLKCHPKDVIVKGTSLEPNVKDNVCCGDITLSSIGWVGLQLPIGVNCTFRAWTPNARGVYLRTPSLVPFAERLIGKRIRNSLAYNISKPFTFRKHKR